LVSGRNYTVYVLPVTGSSGTTPSNYSGYPGIEAYLSNVITGSSRSRSIYTISFTKGFPSSSSQVLFDQHPFLGMHQQMQLVMK
jgi:hypothetical protein